MYNVPIYKEIDQQVILDFLKEYPFALITGIGSDGKPVATQIPFLIEEREDGLYVVGHVMKNTDHCKAFIENPDVLVVFSGPEGYVSAAWCTNPHKGSTWNYMSVHIEGKTHFFEGEKLVTFMQRFTLTHEEGNTNSPTIYDNLSNDYTEKWMPHIIGVEIKIDKLDAVFKLSQGLDKESYANVITQLEQRGNTKLAFEMKKRIK